MPPAPIRPSSRETPGPADHGEPPGGRYGEEAGHTGDYLAGLYRETEAAEALVRELGDSLERVGPPRDKLEEDARRVVGLRERPERGMTETHALREQIREETSRVRRLMKPEPNGDS